MSVFTPEFLSVVLLACLASTLPLLLAAIGETVGEHAGMLGLGLEGALLLSAFAAFATTERTQSFALGTLAGVAAGLAAAAVTLVCAVRLALDQLIVGLAMTLLCSGLTSVCYEAWFGRTSPRLGAPPRILPAAAWLPEPFATVAGPLLTPLATLVAAVLLAGSMGWMLRRTTPGIALRAAGHDPHTLHRLGGSVERTRGAAVLISGVCAGLGGSYLALIAAGTFTPMMTHGLGFIAIVVAMLSRGRMRFVVLCSVLIGCTVAFGTTLQLVTGTVSIDVVNGIPYAVVLVALGVLGRGSRLPQALGTTFVRHPGTPR